MEYMAPIALGAQAGTSLLQFAGTRAAGKISKIESETAAKAEELGAVQREADRKQSLARAMASQIAESGAKGVAAFEGSPLTVLQADIAKEEEATRRDIAQTKLAAMTLRARGKIAKKQAYTMGTINLIGDIGQMAQMAAMAPAGGS